MQYVFWLAFLFCVYTLGGYAACLLVLGLFLRKTRTRQPIEPSVSILIAVRGAEEIIEKKIKNCLELDYPRERVEIVVACDGPSPATAAIVESFADPRIRTISVPRLGKAYALKAALDNSSGEIIVFTDASIQLAVNGLRAIVSNFADANVGCVSSEDVTLSSDGSAEPLYISFDMMIRRLESRVKSLINASGSFFAARREICRNWNTEMSSDFLVPLRSIEAGLDVVLDREALGYVESVKVGQEFIRKVRTIVHGLDVLFSCRQLLNPFKYGIVAWELASHKLFRWLLPFAFLTVLISNCLLWNAGALYRLALICQCIFYGAGLLALAVKPLQRLPPFKVAGFFLLGNVATLQAWRKFLQGERYVTWQPSNRGAIVN